MYRATDTKLKRQVAIKVLPESVAADAERLARFQREAEVLAALNHPNIAAIYGLEDADGVKALVMELVEGPTLADRIAQGAIPIDEALPIAKQMAEALEAAHEQGIVHRDLKPANVKIRRDGTVKVLDFGLAKAMEPIGAMSASVSMSPTITTPAMTQVGMILGTAAYMSPEQAKGQPADRRSDVWSFGAVLFEMLTGRRAFDGEDVADVLASVLQKDVTWAFLPPTTPAHVEGLLRRCLERDRRKRLRDIGDGLLALEGHFQPTDDVYQEAPAWSPDGRLLAFIQGTGSGGRLSVLVVPGDGSTPPRKLSEIDGGSSGLGWTADGRALLVTTRRAASSGASLDIMQLPIDRPGVLEPVVASPFDEAMPQVSPDGRWLAYRSNESGVDEVYVMRFRGSGPRIVISKGGGTMPRWGRDSRELYYAVPESADVSTRPGSIMRVRMQLVADGIQPGAAERVPDSPTVVPAANNGWSYAVSADGRRLLAIVPPSGGTTPITVVKNWESLAR